MVKIWIHGASLLWVSALVSTAVADGSTVRLPVVRDTTLSQLEGESDYNFGGAPRLKLKSNKTMALIDVDPAPLRGRIIRAATLHLRSAGGDSLKRVTVSSFGAEWVEGTAAKAAAQTGSSTFRRRRHPDSRWAYPGSDLCSVMLGVGGTTWRMADTTPPDAQGWQQVPIDPTVVAARVAGLSYGFLLFDDTGSEWKRDGEKFTAFLFPNRLVHSRESGADSAPYMTVVVGPEDRAAPAAPIDVHAEAGDLPAGEAWVSWNTPADTGPAGTAGFQMRVNGQEVPRYLIPLASAAGKRVRMHVRDLGLQPAAEAKLEVQAVDGAGNIGPAATATIRVSARQALALPTDSTKPLAAGKSGPKLGNTAVAVIDELDKVHPVTGAMIPGQPDGYLFENHLWSGATKQVRLHAARNEFVAFQILLSGAVKGVRPTLTFQGGDAGKLQVTFGRYHHVNSKKGPLPDPIVPLTGTMSVPDPDEDLVGQKNGSLHCEIYVPHDTGTGPHSGTLVLQAEGEKLTLDVSLNVWDVTLPDYLSFLPEMNCYGLPQNERAYYRLAHRHRTVLNRVPYSQNGTLAAGCAPRWDGSRLDWSAWDQRFGPYFDGFAFADLPRKGVPLDIFYLPLHENWPSPMEQNYNGNYWADRAFPPEYRSTFVQVSRQMAEHCNSKGWKDTLFQCFFNNKYYYKEKNGWSRGSSPWLLDEPSNFKDYWALRFFGAAFHEGVAKARGPAKMSFRCDISRPQWQRDTFDGLLDYNVEGAAVRQYHRHVFDRKEANGELVIEYGTTNAIETSNMQPLGWTLDTWALGSDGVLPWQVIGNSRSWEQADTLSLFYPGRGKDREPVPSVRLKAFRRGQQDVEYLMLWALLHKQPRWAIGQSVRRELRLLAERKETGIGGDEDAGMLDYYRLRPQDVWSLRIRVGQALSDAKPIPQRRLVELRTPPRDTSTLPAKNIVQ